MVYLFASLTVLVVCSGQTLSENERRIVQNCKRQENCSSHRTNYKDTNRDFSPKRFSGESSTRVHNSKPYNEIECQINILMHADIRK